MSTYSRLTKNPKTDKFEMAVWHDDYFAPRHYGVRFPNGDIVDPELVELETKESVSAKNAHTPTSLEDEFWYWLVYAPDSGEDRDTYWEYIVEDLRKAIAEEKIRTKHQQSQEIIAFIDSNLDDKATKKDVLLLLKSFYE